MKNLRNLLAVITLMAVLMVTASTAKAGIMLSDLQSGDPQPCTQTTGDSTNWGILVTGLTGILVTGFTGILVTGAADTPVNCGIMLSD